MAFKIADAVLKFAVDGFVQFLDDVCAGGTGARVVRFDVLDKDGEGLRAVAEVRRALLAGAFCGVDHDACFAEAQLSAGERVSVMVVLDESECRAEPFERLWQIFVNDVWKYCVYGNGTIVQHGITLRRSDSLINHG